MTQLSANFTLEEFLKSDTATKLGIKNTASPEIVLRLTKVANFAELVKVVLKNGAVLIMSCYRNPQVNKAVGGVPNSDHALGWAFDFKCPSFGNPLEVALAIQAHAKKTPSFKFDQLIHEKKPDGAWWVHLSINPRMRGQTLTFNGTSYIVGIHPVKH